MCLVLGQLDGPRLIDIHRRPPFSEEKRRIGGWGRGAGGTGRRERRKGSFHLDVNYIN